MHSRSVLALLTLLTVAACQTSSIAAQPMAGTIWRVNAINGRATPTIGPYRMNFEAVRLGGQFGCNHFGGEYRVRGDIIITGATAMTEMACSDPADTFEGWGLAIIQRPMRMIWSGGDRLTLSNSAGSIELARSY